MYYFILQQVAFIGWLANHSIEITFFLTISFLAGFFVKHYLNKKLYKELAEYKQQLVNYQSTFISTEEETISLKQTVQRQKQELQHLISSKNSNNDITNFKKQLAEKDEEIVLLRSELVLLKEKELMIAKKSTSEYLAIKKDDLKIIEGIGPKIEKMLFEAKIFTYEELKNQSPEKLSFIIIHLGGDRYKIHDPTSWPIQAEMAYIGNWTELKNYQKELNLRINQPK